MNIIKSLIFVFVFGVGSLETYAGISVRALTEVRNCLAILKNPSNAGAPEDLRQKCYELALPMKEDSSVSARALYISARANFVESYSKQSYELLLIELNTYFRTHLLDVLENTGFSLMSNLEVEEIFDAMADMQFYSSLISEHHLVWSWLESAVPEMKARGLWTNQRAKIFFDLLLAQSEWSKARELSLQFAHLRTLPEIDESLSLKAGELAYFEYSEDLETAALQKFHFSEGPQIIIFGDCHFATDSFRRLSQMSGVNEIVNKFGLTIASASGIELEDLSQFRQEFRSFDLHPIYRSGAWSQKGFNVLEMPNFTFLLDGEVKFSFTGSAEVEEKFCRGLDSIGILRPGGCKPLIQPIVPQETK